MKFLTLLFVLFSAVNLAKAQKLCDESCVLSITFPQGGSLEAFEELTLTFGIGGELIAGTGGTVNKAIQPTDLDFSSGGVLVLLPGESISFGQNGSMRLGSGGNMEATNYSLITTGDITIEAIGGSQAIYITGSWSVTDKLTFSSTSLDILSTVSVDSHLAIQNGTTIAGSGSIDIGTAGVLSIGNEISLTPATLTLSQNSGIINNTGTLTIDPINLQPLEDLNSLNGIELQTGNGESCIVDSSECVTEDGTVYILSDGQLVKKEAPSSSSGTIGLPILIFFMILLLFYRKKYRVYELGM